MWMGTLKLHIAGKCSKNVNKQEPTETKRMLKGNIG